MSQVEVFCGCDAV